MKDQDHRKKKRKTLIHTHHRRIVRVLACFVVFVTTYALILPAITMEREAYCGHAAHTHSDSCYTNELICGQEEYDGHTHTDACYETMQVMTCGQEESAGHTHTEDCYNSDGELICGMEESAGHTHTDACYTTEKKLVCGKEEGTGHKHSDACYKKVLTCGLDEHTHSLACYSNPYADVETREQWEKTLPDQEKLTGIWADDLLTVAESQLGYQESVLNYEVAGKATKGYTRFGAWYGVPYGDWCAMYISFCLHYAGIPKEAMPYEASCGKWTEKLEKEKMYVDAKDGKPRPGDLVFFENTNDKDEVADHVGIVTKVDKKKGIDTIEGNTANKVAHRHYDWDDERIQGYGMLPENPNPPKEGEAKTVDQAKDTAAEPAALTLTGEDGNVSVRVDAPDGAFPDGTTMEVSAVASDDVMDAVSGAVDSTVVRVDAVDISFHHDGKEIEPAKPIRVAMEPKKSAPKADPLVVHVEDSGKAAQIDTMSVPDGEKGTLFEADTFSVYALVYTVDFYYGADSEEYEMHMPGGGYLSLLEMVRTLSLVEDDQNTPEDETVAFMADIDKVSFSSPELMSISKAEEETTVGAIKQSLGLQCEYSSELTEEDIAAIDEQAVAAGDYALISLKPFDTEESLTITMKNGDAFTIRVRDAHEITGSSAGSIDAGKSYLICYEANGQYYLLKNDGSVDSSHTPANFEGLNSTYCWSFNYVFEEKHLESTMTYVYYLIRPIDRKSNTIALNKEGEDLVQFGNNNVAVIPADGGGFHLIGYNGVKLDFANGTFFGDQLPEGNDGITVHIYEMDTLPTYDYTVSSFDSERGYVQVGSQSGNSITTASNSDKKNAETITAVPARHQNGDLNPGETGYGQNKWEFDHWEQDGLSLDRDEYPATINANTLPIPFNGSNLVAHFRQNSHYVVPNSEKQPSSFEDMTNWFNELTTRAIPLDASATEKTAEVYDYENRIYRVDITSKADFDTFDGNVDMAFCLDVSNSMKFPSKLVPTTASYYNGGTSIPIYQINNSGWGWSNQGWLDTSRGLDNPYYLIADPNGTATVFKIYYKGGEWRAIDASRPDDSDNTKWFRIGNDFETTWTKGKNSDNRHPFSVGDDDNTKYTIYDAGDEGRNRFFYLNESFLGATTDLKTIKDTLAVAGAQSPQVRVAYNTFNKNLGSGRQDFQIVTPLTVNFAYSAGGGTRPDQAFNDARSFSWSGQDRYVVLITDGAPQGVRDGEPKETSSEDIYNQVRQAAQNLKNEDHVKFITIGLSMDDVTSGKQLLYDLADTDKDGNKMFYMAESASDLPNIMRQITKTIMADATVIADVTDKVNEAFYLVDKNTGLPLTAGNKIDIEGNLTNDPSKAAGIVQPDGRTIKWFDQPIDQQNGWHGTVYVKAKEDLLGGNAVKTNDVAEVKATKYTLGDQEISFDQSAVHDKLRSLEVDLPTPRVNVNELTFPSESTEWTVYLGTSVDPEEQLKQMYEDILVTEVVNEDGSLHYPIAPNSIVDDRTGGVSDTVQTFPLAPEILTAIKADPASAAKYVQNGQLNWDAFLTDIQKPEGVTVPYHKYGVEGEDSNIVITLTEKVLGDEKDVNESPHQTSEVNGTDEQGGSVSVEKYVFTVQYNPDYDHVLPPGQGGDPNNNVDYHTGTFGSMYQGHATGRETSTNTHVINVFAKGLQILKTETDGTTILPGTKFTLFRTARSSDDQSQVTTIEGVEGSYYPAAELTTDENGKAVVTPVEQLAQGEQYYLVETQEVEGYNRLKVPIPVTLTIYNTYRPHPDGQSQTDKPPNVVYDWTQTAKLELGAGSGVWWTDAENNVQTGQMAADSTNETIYYRIDNTSGYVLPHTGGIGTGWMSLAGGFLIVFALAYYGCDLRRRRKGGQT